MHIILLHDMLDLASDLRAFVDVHLARTDALAPATLLPVVILDDLVPTVADRDDLRGGMQRRDPLRVDSCTSFGCVCSVVALSIVTN